MATDIVGKIKILCVCIFANIYIYITHVCVCFLLNYVCGSLCEAMHMRGQEPTSLAPVSPQSWMLGNQSQALTKPVLQP